MSTIIAALGPRLLPKNGGLCLRFEVPGAPLTWKRTNDFRGRHLTSAEQRVYQQHVKRCAWASMAGHRWPLSARYRVTVLVYAKTRARSDVDNFGKQALDSLRGVCFGDDWQVDELHVIRAHDPVRPRLDITVEVLDA